MKIALGAARARIGRQLLLESLLVSSAGGLLGLLFAWWALKILPSKFAPEHAVLLNPPLDWPVVVWMVIGCAALGVLCGLAPLLLASRVTTAQALRAEATNVSDDAGTGHLRSAFVVAQVALSTALLLAAGVLHRAIDEALAGGTPRGHTRIVATVDLTSAAPDTGAAAVMDAIASALTDQHEDTWAGWTTRLPLGSAVQRRFSILRSDATPLASAEADIATVTARYLRQMSMRVIAGRSFNRNDRAGAPPVVLANEAFEQRYFGRRAVGHAVRGPDGVAREIVGVVTDGDFRTLQGAPSPTLFYNAIQESAPARYFLVVGGRAQESALRSAVSRELTARGIQVDRLATLNEHLSEFMAADRMLATLVSAAGVLSLVLALIGVYGVMADAVARRTREVALRLALGAETSHVIRLVLAGIIGVTCIGVAAGFFVAFVLARVAQSLVFGIPAGDAAVYAGTAVAMAAVVICAAAIPMKRALTISPTAVLRRG